MLNEAELAEYCRIRALEKDLQKKKRLWQKPSHERWVKDGEVQVDKRPTVKRPTPSNWYKKRCLMKRFKGCRFCYIRKIKAATFQIFLEKMGIEIHPLVQRNSSV